jgi:hypothetical protein
MPQTLYVPTSGPKIEVIAETRGSGLSLTAHLLFEGSGPFERPEPSWKIVDVYEQLIVLDKDDKKIKEDDINEFVTTCCQSFNKRIADMKNARESQYTIKLYEIASAICDSLDLDEYGKILANATIGALIETELATHVDTPERLHINPFCFTNILEHSILLQKLHIER